MKNYNAEISNLLNSQCMHRSHYNYNYGNHRNLVVCDQTGILFDEAISLGEKISFENIQKFINYVKDTANGNIYSQTKTCCVQNTINVVKILILVLENSTDNLDTLKPALDILLIQISEHESSDQIFRFLEKKSYKFDGSLEGVISHRLKHFCDARDDKAFCDTLMNAITIDNKNLKKLCQNRNSYLSSLIASIMDKYDGELDSSFILKSVIYMPYTKSIIQSLVGRGVQITDEIAETSCQHNETEDLDFILTLGRLPIKKSYFEKTLISKTYSQKNVHQKNIYYGYHNIDNDGFSSSYSPQKINVLINHGYVIDQEDLKHSIKAKVELPNIERFKLKLDQDILDLCYVTNFYPQYDFDCIEKSLLELQNLCTGRSSRAIAQHIKKHKLVPDKRCMENASNFKSNKMIMDILFNAGGEITYTCILNCASQLNSSQMLLDMLRIYGKKQEKTFKKQEKLINELKNEVVALGGNIEKYNTSKKNCKKVKDTNAEKEESDDEVEEKKNNIKGTNHRIKEKNIDEEISLEDDDKEELYEDIVTTKKILDIPEVGIPSQKRKKQNIPDIYKEYFNKEDSKMSFIELKKDFIDNIRKNKWYDEGDNKMIVLPNDLRDKLNLGEGLIRFEDLEKTTGLFYIQ